MHLLVLQQNSEACFVVPWSSEVCISVETWQKHGQHGDELHNAGRVKH